MPFPALDLLEGWKGSPYGPENRTHIPSLASVEERMGTCVDWSTSPLHEHQVLLKQAASLLLPSCVLCREKNHLLCAG